MIPATCAPIRLWPGTLCSETLGFRMPPTASAFQVDAGLWDPDLATYVADGLPVGSYPLWAQHHLQVDDVNLLCQAN